VRCSARAVVNAHSERAGANRQPLRVDDVSRHARARVVASDGRIIDYCARPQGIVGRGCRFPDRISSQSVRDKKDVATRRTVIVRREGPDGEITRQQPAR
jgi:hypothetical protein